MEIKKKILYMKGESCISVSKKEILLKDLLKLECSDEKIVKKLENILVLKICSEKNKRYILSVLKIIQMIHKYEPDLEICNLGCGDFIVKYEIHQKKDTWVQAVKMIFVVLITFVGASFSIMTFNNDAGIPNLFSDIYLWVMGREKEGFSVLEFAYSIGISIGILVFFNHFGKKKFTEDPTPIEVEMRLYENNIQTTLIQNDSRKGLELDVDTADHTDSDWS